MQEPTESTIEELGRLKKRVQELEEEVAKLKMKISGRKWL